jgi:putative ABC transport system permease protein
MLRNFFRIAIRNILKYKGFSFINVAGLAIGLAASLLILLWVQDELSFERFNKNAENIYRVEEDQFYSGARYHVTVTPFPSGPVWKQQIPEIEEQTRVHPWLPRMLFRQGEKVFFESSILAADSTFLNIFTFPLQTGDENTALASPHSILLSEKLAMKYFGEKNPVGKTITIENRDQFMVTGILKKLPKNSMFNFEAVIPIVYLKEIGQIYDGWGSNSYFTFVRLKKGADIKAVNKKLTDIVVEHDPEITTKFLLFPLLDIHLHQQFGFKETKGPIVIVFIFTLIAVFVMLIACINFINLSTARAASRGKEIGIKKVAGADQMSLIWQFMFESLLLVSAALVLALILVGLFLNVFNGVSGKNFTLSDLLQVKFILSFIAVGLVAGFVSGIYPSLYLSSFKPVVVLKGGDTATGRGHIRMRQTLVVIQFSLSMLIAIAAIFTYLQLKFMLEKDLGFNKNNLIGIQMTDNMRKKYYSIKSELLKETLIQGVTASTWNPVMIGSNSGGARWEGKDPDKNVLIGTNTIDYDYIETMQMEIVSGRDFSRDYSSDIARDTTGNFLVNEEVVQLMNIGDPVGKGFRFMGLNGRIVGVMKNFHFKGADQPIEPVAFALTDTSSLNMILIRLAPADIPGSLKVVEKKWKEIIPEYPLQYNFIDQDYENQFRSMIRLTGLLKYFTILALIIASLGLYGLASYSAERRTNEVGIRKVMGAGSLTVMYTLTREFLVFVLMAIVVSVPLGWYIVSKLLQQFAYRVDINPLVFVYISAGAILIAIITVSFQAYKATGINPAEALKIE